MTTSHFIPLRTFTIKHRLSQLDIEYLFFKETCIVIFHLFFMDYQTLCACGIQFKRTVSCSKRCSYIY